MLAVHRHNELRETSQFTLGLIVNFNTLKPTDDVARLLLRVASQR